MLDAALAKSVTLLAKLVSKKCCWYAPVGSHDSFCSCLPEDVPAPLTVRSQGTTYGSACTMRALQIEHSWPELPHSRPRGVNPGLPAFLLSAGRPPESIVPGVQPVEKGALWLRKMAAELRATALDQLHAAQVNGRAGGAQGSSSQLRQAAVRPNVSPSPAKDGCSRHFRRGCVLLPYQGCCLFWEPYCTLSRQLWLLAGAKPSIRRVHCI